MLKVFGAETRTLGASQTIEFTFNKWPHSCERWKHLLFTESLLEQQILEELGRADLLINQCQGSNTFAWKVDCPLSMTYVSS